MRSLLVDEQEKVSRVIREEQDLRSLLAAEKDKTTKIGQEEQALRASLEDEKENATRIRQEVVGLRVVLAAEKEKAMRVRQEMDEMQVTQARLIDEARQRACLDLERQNRLLRQYSGPATVQPPNLGYSNELLQGTQITHHRDRGDTEKQSQV